MKKIYKRSKQKTDKDLKINKNCSTDIVHTHPYSIPATIYASANPVTIYARGRVFVCYSMTFVAILTLSFSKKSCASYIPQTEVYNLDTHITKTYDQQNTDSLSPARLSSRETPNTQQILNTQTQTLNMQLLKAVKKLKSDNQNLIDYEEIKNALHAGADPLFKEKGSTIDAFHLFLMYRSKKAPGYKSTEQTFLKKME
ncbi:MAG: hypothetical protein NT124_02190 [Candidatus Dependentiae bacterium]|nr:hypothetical protein [Candidatus Dependentiae bacterium]